MSGTTSPSVGLALPVVKGHQLEVDPAVVWALRQAVKGATQGDLYGERAKGRRSGTTSS